MKGLWRIQAFYVQLLRKHYQKSLMRQCQSVGKNLLVKGPTRIRNAGEIHLGDECILDATKEHPICLDVGSRAILNLGDGVYLNEGVHIICNISISIGAHCLIASDVMLMDDDGHQVDWHARHGYWPENPEDRLGAPIILEDNVWIGTRAIILNGVTIGEGAVIGAGAVVTRSIPSQTLAVGVPAKVVRQIIKNE